MKPRSLIVTEKDFSIAISEGFTFSPHVPIINEIYTLKDIAKGKRGDMLIMLEEIDSRASDGTEAGFLAIYWKEVLPPIDIECFINELAEATV